MIVSHDFLPPAWGLFTDMIADSTNRDRWGSRGKMFVDDP